MSNLQLDGREILEGKRVSVSENIEEMSWEDIILSTEEDLTLSEEQEAAPVEAPVVVVAPVEVPAAPVEVPVVVQVKEPIMVEAEKVPAVTAGVKLPELFTPAPDSTWEWQQVKEHEDAIQALAFDMLKMVLGMKDISYEDVSDSTDPYTVMVGPLKVQNILLPGDHPQIVVFKGIRIIPPEDLVEESTGKTKRVAAFRRKRKEGPFNYQGLVERIQRYLSEVQQARDSKRLQTTLAAEARELQLKELGDSVPSGLSLSRQVKGTYNGTLTFSEYPLSKIKELVKLISG